MKFYIVGAGGFGKELCAWILKEHSDWTFKGYLDDSVITSEVVGTLIEHKFDSTCAYFVAIGDGYSRVKILEKILTLGGNVPSYISNAVRSAVDLGETRGCLFLGACSISNNNKFGLGVVVQALACTGHDVELEQGVTIGTHAFVAGNVNIGKFTTVNPHSSIAPGLKVGRDVTIGLGSIVIQSVPDSVVMFGNPAKILMAKKR